MGTSKVKTVQANGTYEGRNGLMYKFEIGLEDDRMKLTKPGFTPNQGGSQSPDIQKRIDASWAIGHAINQESDPEKIIEAAEWLLKIRNTLISKL